MQTSNDYFADFDDTDLSAEAACYEDAAPGQDYAEPIANKATHWEPCQKCRGSGLFYGYRGDVRGQCYACKGAKGFERKTSPEARAKAKAAKVAREERARVATLNTFAEQHPAAWTWIAANTGRFDFATALSAAIAKYGHLTDNQLAAVERCIAKDATRAAEKAAREAGAPEVTVEPIEAAFAKLWETKGKAKGIAHMRLRLGAFTFKPASGHSQNAGAIYVTEGEDYLGKIQGGKFKRTFACTAETEAEVVKVCADPQKEAIAYGKRYGICAVCGRGLENAESIERGIGPICAEKFGW